MNRRLTLLYVVFLLFFLVLSYWELFAGIENIEWRKIPDFLFGKEENIVFWQIRFPRYLTAISAGVGLAVSGLLMQSIFRNPLAGPYVLGVSSGASLGVALIIMGQQIFFPYITFFSGSLGLILGALVGAFAVISLIIWASKYISGLSTLLILGILFSGAASALINILQYFAQAANIKMYIVWTLGNLGGITLSQSVLLISFIFLATFPAFLSVKSLDAMNLGEQEAIHLGINLKKSRILILLISGVLTALVTAFAGPIAFIGLIVPHISRILSKSILHINIIPLSIFLGSDILLLSDIISRINSALYTIPINSVTSVIGIPIVAWLLIKNNEINF